jgi:hypothetical protein
MLKERLIETGHFVFSLDCFVNRLLRGNHYALIFIRSAHPSSVITPLRAT